MDLNINNALNEDEYYKEGNEEFDKAMELAQSVSEEITANLVQEIVKQNDETGDKANNLTLTIAIIACARAMVNLSSYAYDTEQEYKDDIVTARESVVNKIVPALLDPQPCGQCEACKKGEPCINPDLDTKMLQTKTIPMVADALVEYDTWNKIMYLYTEGRELLLKKEGKASEKETEDMASEESEE